MWKSGQSLCHEQFAAQAISSGLESAGQPALFSSFNKTWKKKEENKKRYLTILKKENQSLIAEIDTLFAF